MKVYRGTFKKKNGELRTMKYVHLDDLPEEMKKSIIKGTGAPRKLEEGQELVYDVEAEGLRIFDNRTIIGEVTHRQVNSLSAIL